MSELITPPDLVIGPVRVVSTRANDERRAHHLSLHADDCPCLSFRSPESPQAPVD